MPIQNLQNNSDEEILIKDESGNFLIYSQGELKPYLPSKIPVRQPVVLTQLIDTGMEEPMLQPPPPVVRKKTASFYFHPADEEEVAKIGATTKAIFGKRYSLNKIVNKIMENYQLVLNESLQERFKNAILSFLRDRRTLIDFQEALVRSEVDGGLSLPVDQVEKITSFLKEIKEKVEQEGGLVIDERVETLAAAEAKKYIPTEEIKLSEPAIKLQPVPKIEGVPAEKKEFKVPPSTRFKFQRPLKKGKIADVRKDYKLFGPVEELASLDLATFKRLGATTAERAEKIVSRIESLAHESLTKKAAGLKAWRSCPLYRMYLAVGQAGMEHNLPVAQIINQYQSAGKEIIILEEFEAITDINRRLRF